MGLAIITSFTEESISQNQLKSLGYEGESLFKIPVYEPQKVDLDYNKLYEKPKSIKVKKPETNTSIKEYPAVKPISKPLDEIIAETFASDKNKPKSIKPKSLNDSYSGGFVEKVITTVKEANELKEQAYSKTTKKVAAPVRAAKPNTPRSLTPKVSEDKGVEVKNQTYVKNAEIMEVNSIVIPFKPEVKNKISKPRKKPVIIIDPGHGGKDPGAIGKLGTKEKQITFLYSAELKKELERTGKYKVFLTRYGDKYVGLKTRVDKARRSGGDIMLSIHADSIANPNVRGFSVYTISNRRVKREANKLSRLANKKEVLRGVKMKGESKDVQEALIDFAQKETKSVSDSFSKILAKKLGQEVKPLRRTNREGSLAVLTGADIPSVLLELGYLSNKFEEKLLRQKNHRRKIVKSIVAAIDEYFETFDFFLE